MTDSFQIELDNRARFLACSRPNEFKVHVRVAGSPGPVHHYHFACQSLHWSVRSNTPNFIQAWNLNILTIQQIQSSVRVEEVILIFLNVFTISCVSFGKSWQPATHPEFQLPNLAEVLLFLNQSLNFCNRN